MKTKLLKFCTLSIILFLTFNANAQYWKLTGNAGISSSNFLGTTDSQAVQFKTNNKVRMTIKPGGSIGIGTGSPSGKLNIDGGSNLSLATGGYQIIGKVSGYNLAFDTYNIQGRNNGSALNININPFGGTVYLGNQTESYYGAVANGFVYGLLAGSSTGTGLFGSSSSGTGVYGSSSTGSGVIGNASTSGGNNSRGLQGFGNYGIYATTYNNDLYYAGYFAGDVVTSGVYSNSDEKLKQNIKEVASAMDIIGQLRPKTYQFRQDSNYSLMHLPHGQHYGLIAQEVEKVLPGMVKNSKFDVGIAIQNEKPATDAKHPDADADNAKNTETIDFKAVNYTEMIPIIIKGMQEQQQTIKGLQQLAAQQQQTIAEQQEQITQLLAANVPSSNTIDHSTVSAVLQQNAPNPFSSNTIIHCYIPPASQQAQLRLYGSNGTLLKVYTLGSKGLNEVTINGGTLSSGQYTYSLMIDGKTVDSKSMILTK